MAFQNVWTGPAFISAYSILALLICFLLSYHHSHLPSRWPFLRPNFPVKFEHFSEIATKPPESNVYSLMVNHVSLMVAFWAYLKHRELVSYFMLEHQMTKRRILSFVNMCIGMLGAFAMQMSVNFPKTKVPYIQTFSSLILLVCLVIYVWVHTVFSFFIVDDHIPRKKLFAVRSTLAAAISSCAANMLKVFEIRGHNFDKTTPSPLDDTQNGAIFEWGIYLSMSLFLLTDAYEFQSLSFTPPKLVIPGSERYDESRLLIPPRAERPRVMSFTDLPSTSLQSSMVW